MSGRSRTRARLAFDTPEDRVRSLATLLGIGGIAFGALPAISPQAFGRVFGSRVGDDPSTAAAYRSVGVRDAVVGVGLWSAAYHGGHYAPWLLARMLIDAGASAGGLLAIAQGARRPGFLGLVGLSMLTAAGTYGLWSAAKRVDSEASGAALIRKSG
jgi:hypothetical protein